ncbi:MAG: M24 family metallopeptidase [Candidatus Bathyarchaeia archaeon]
MQDVVKRIREEIQASSFDALIVFGADNIQYLSRLRIPHQSISDRTPVLMWPRIGEPTIICTPEWRDAIRVFSFIKRVIGYEEGLESLIDVIVKEVKSSLESGARIGFDSFRTPAALFEELSQKLRGFELLPCDGLIRRMRIVKTQSELDLLEDIAYSADHGIFGAAHHVLVTSHRSEMSLSEEIRVHCMERGLDVIGFNSVSLVASGEHTKKFWPLAPRYGVGYSKPLGPGEFVRMEMRISLDGYWSNAARMMTQGDPNQLQRAAYEDLVALRKRAEECLKPGARCSEVYKTVKSEAEKRGVTLVDGLAIGHGIGVTDYEPPYLSASDDTELTEGMVLVLDPVIVTPEGEILRSKDTVLITAEGCKIVGWYKDWREPYIANYTL